MPQPLELNIEEVFPDLGHIYLYIIELNKQKGLSDGEVAWVNWQKNSRDWELCNLHPRGWGTIHPWN